MRTLATSLLCLLLSLPVGCRTAGTVRTPTGLLDDETIERGLKEALRIGTGNAVDRVGRLDGYFKNAAIKILVPEELKLAADALQAARLDHLADSFVLSMNRAAEAAAPHARDIFLNAIADMTIRDVVSVWRGGETAATDYFRRVTEEDLKAAFRPHIDRALDEYEVTRRYRAMTDSLRGLPMSGIRTVDLEDYVLSEALDGLFLMLADEERKIRTDPAARVTDLLRTVFG